MRVSADERKLELMKAAGYNAVRSAHNPASQATLDAADRLGMLVIDEAFDMWSVGKRKNDYSRFFKDNWRADVSSMIWSGRNHPSIVMWSLGNEIPNLADETGRAEAKALADLVHQLDPTRPTTAAVHLFVKNTETFFEILDVAGYNYRRENYLSDHAAFPKRVIYGSESFSAQAFDYWAPTETMPWVIGDFVWTAVDYLGEASIGEALACHDAALRFEAAAFAIGQIVATICGTLPYCLMAWSSTTRASSARTIPLTASRIALT